VTFSVSSELDLCNDLRLSSYMYLCDESSEKERLFHMWMSLSLDGLGDPMKRRISISYHYVLLTGVFSISGGVSVQCAAIRFRRSIDSQVVVVQIHFVFYTSKIYILCN